MIVVQDETSPARLGKPSDRYDETRVTDRMKAGEMPRMPGTATTARSVRSRVQTPDPSDTAACHAVLGTCELLEAILVEVDTKTLLLAQRACTWFKAVIDRSGHLQQALFFKPAPTDGRRFGVDGRNPLLIGSSQVHQPPPAKKTRDQAVIDDDPFADDRMLARVVGRAESNHLEEPAFVLELNWDHTEVGPDWGQDERWHSWRRMFPFQAPYRWRWRGGDGEECDRSTMGMIIDLFEEKCGADTDKRIKRHAKQRV